MLQQAFDKQRGTCVRLVVCLALGVLLLACGTSHADVSTVTLFELFYGEEESEIGISLGQESHPAGPSGLVVGATGDVYIVDSLHGKMKQFDDTGQLVMATEGRLFGMAPQAIAPDGRIWVATGSAGRELIEFNPDGSQVRSVNDEEGRVVEPRGGDYIISQIVEWMGSRGLPRYPEIEFLHCDQYGGLYVGICGNQMEPGASGASARAGVFVFSPTMQLTAVLRGNFVSPDGYVHSISGRHGENRTETLTVYTADGVKERDLVVPEPVSAADILPWRGGENAGRWYYVADRTAIYMLDAIHRKNVGKTAYWLTESLQVGCDLSVVKTDREGRLLAAFRLPYGPFIGCRPVFVHPSGDIYYLEFGPESLTVNLIPVETLQAAAEKAPSKIVMVREMESPESRTVALRTGLDGKEWHFKWDAKGRRAIAENAGVRLEVPIDGNYVIINDKKVPVAKPAYILSGRTYIPCSLISEVVSARAAA